MARGCMDVTATSEIGQAVCQSVSQLVSQYILVLSQLLPLHLEACCNLVTWRPAAVMVLLA